MQGLDRHRRRYCRYYVQSKLAGIQKIFVGHRDPSFELRKTEWLALDSLPDKFSESWVCDEYLYVP